MKKEYELIEKFVDKKIITIFTPTEYEVKLFERYGLDKLPDYIISNILKQKKINGYKFLKDSITVNEEWIKCDIESIIEKLTDKEPNYVFVGFIGSRLKAIEYLEGAKQIKTTEDWHYNYFYLNQSM